MLSSSTSSSFPDEIKHVAKVVCTAPERSYAQQWRRGTTTTPPRRPALTSREPRQVSQFGATDRVGCTVLGARARHHRRRCRDIMAVLGKSSSTSNVLPVPTAALLQTSPSGHDFVLTTTAMPTASAADPLMPPALPPRFRLRDLILGPDHHFLFNDDGERYPTT